MPSLNLGYAACVAQPKAGVLGMAAWNRTVESREGRERRDIQMSRMKTQSAHRNVRVAMAMLMGALLALVLVPGSARAQEMTDAMIAAAVEDEILFDPSVSLNRIEVSTLEGVVTLKGNVGNLLAKERAARIAETVKGVTGVVNQLVVRTEPVDDMTLATRVKGALLSNPATEAHEIIATADDGAVTLSGTVQSWQEKQIVMKAAKGVTGVQSLNDQLMVEYALARTDEEIRPEIEQALKWDVLVDHALIDVGVTNGNVMLTGTVGSAAEKRRAIADAWVAGVTSVDASGLEVARWARDEDLRADKYEPKPDDEIAVAATAAIAADPRVEVADVTVLVNAGNVTLSGSVGSLQAKRAAAQDARNTVGVVNVSNRLRVRPNVDVSDAKLADDIRAALSRDPYIERFDVDVSVYDGVATLTGTVDTYFEKSQAQDVAAGVAGVEDVNNYLSVWDVRQPLVYDPYVHDYDVYAYDWYDYEPYYTYVDDVEILKDIRDELWWSPFVDSDDVTVTVDNGTATLTGTVESWSERQAAVDNAYQGGATWVVNNLDVK